MATKIWNQRYDTEEEAQFYRVNCAICGSETKTQQRDGAYWVQCAKRPAHKGLYVYTEEDE